MNQVYKNSAYYWKIFAWAAFSFATTLFLQYQGEEGVYTITSLEMAFNHEWIAPTQYGTNYARPPFYNWLMIPVATLLGWSNVLVAARLVTALCTILTGLFLAWFVNRLFKDKTLSAFTAVVYLSGDVLFKRGWLAYADPLFSLFVFASMALLWVSAKERKISFLMVALVCVSCGFLTKALTAYVFYGLTLFVLLFQKSYRSFLLSPQSLIAHFLALAFLLAWSFGISHGAHGGSMVSDIITKLNLTNLGSYLLKIVLYPLDTAMRWLPASLVLLCYGFYALYKFHKASQKKKSFLKPKTFSNVFSNENIQTAAWILLLNYLPYWLAPETRVRYILPLFSLFSLVIAYTLWQLGTKPVKITVNLLLVCIVIRYALGVWGFPYYEKKYRGDYAAIAAEILTTTKDIPTKGNPYPLYTDDDSATGLSVTANLDVLRLSQGQAPLTRPPQSWNQGFVLAYTPHFPNTHITRVFELGHNKLYFLCRGESCPQ